MLRALILAIGCARAADPEPLAEEAPVRASIEVLTPKVADAADLRVAVTVTNDSGAPVAVNTLFFDLPVISLEARDARGEPVPKGPPPVPPVDDGSAVRTLAPSESLQLQFHGSSVFGVELDPGDYEIRYHTWAPGETGFHGEITSPWAPFHVGR